MGSLQESSESSVKVLDITQMQNATNNQLDETNTPPGSRTSELPTGTPIPIIGSDCLISIKEPLHEEKSLLCGEDESISNNVVDSFDSFDSSLFSPELSRHSIEVALRRARTLEKELKEIEQNEPLPVQIASKSLPGSILDAIKSLTGARTKNGVNYSRLENPNQASDIDGDGMQLSPQNSRQSLKSSCKLNGTRPAIKKTSSYCAEGKVIKATTSKKGIQWKMDLLQSSPGDDSGEFGENSSLVEGDGNMTRKKNPTKGMIRRLNMKEKEELYQLRPDLKIVPNWAQKYREEINGNAETVQCNHWLLVLILLLMILLIALLILISHAAKQSL